MCWWLWPVLGWVWPFFGWVWMSVSVCDLFWLGVGKCYLFWLNLGRCGLLFGWVWMGLTFVLAEYGWVWLAFSWVRVGVTFFWLGVECVWPFSNWVLVGVSCFYLGVGGYDLFGWVWVGEDECTVYSYPIFIYQISRVWLLTIPICHVFTYRSSLIKTENTGYFTHSKKS